MRLCSVAMYFKLDLSDENLFKLSAFLSAPQTMKKIYLVEVTKDLNRKNLTKVFIPEKCVGIGSRVLYVFTSGWKKDNIKCFPLS